MFLLEKKLCKTHCQCVTVNGKAEPCFLSLAKKEFRAKNSMQTKVYLESHRGALTGVAQWITKGCRFDFQSGHVTGLWARSLAQGVQEATDQCFSPSPSPSLPLPLKQNQ